MNAGIDTKESSMSSKEIIDRIFKEPGIKYELTEFEDFGQTDPRDPRDLPENHGNGPRCGQDQILPEELHSLFHGKRRGSGLCGRREISPEEIVRQLWVYKLIHQYGYKADEIDLEKGVQFGTEVGTKAADIIVYTDATKETPKIIVECKKPKRKDGIEQLKSYMNAKGAPVAVWSNGSDSIILYRPYPKEFDNTLFDIPKRGRLPKDVLEAKKTLLQLKMSLYLNSLAGKLQVEKYQRGSSGQLELYPFDIRKFQVWEAPQSIQQEIRRLYEQATESARQSRELLDQAKSRVEQLIEEAVRT